MENEKQVAPKGKFPYRLGFGILFGLLGWLVPYLGVNSTLCRQRFNRLHQTKGSDWRCWPRCVVATIANIIEGALSDRTVSRWENGTWIF